MTPFVQPLDAGIIRCFKAHYHKQMCLRAIELDDAGEDDIYKLNLREVMLMAKAAWDAVSPRRLWHAGITPGYMGSLLCHRLVLLLINLNRPKLNESARMPSSERHMAGWSVMHTFAMGGYTMPEAENKLEELLGNDYTHNDWKPAFDAIFNAEENTEEALQALEALMSKQNPLACLPEPDSHSDSRALIQQLSELEDDLTTVINNLVSHWHIHGTVLTLEDLLNPIEEVVANQLDPSDSFPSGDANIIKEVRCCAADSIESESIEVDSDGDMEDVEEGPAISVHGAMTLCKDIDKVCLLFPNVDGVS